ncbi:MAG: ArsR/SmtB family transcription factor [Ferrimicrobium sp.]
MSIVDGDANIAPVAALMGEPARALVLMALADGRALAASTLATEAGVAASTISGHLARLVNGGLITVEVSGRHRYFRLAGPEVAQAVEALALLSPAQPIRSLRQGTHAEAIRRARTCYDHLAGRLGVAICDSMVAGGALSVEVRPNGGLDPVLGIGRSQLYVLTDDGRAFLATLGVVLDASSRRPLTRYCLDWSEQRPHLGGALGAALLDRLVDLKWVIRAERRVIRITSAGRMGLAAELGIDTTVLA